jgi:hypothetical protein
MRKKKIARWKKLRSGQAGTKFEIRSTCLRVAASAKAGETRNDQKGSVHSVGSLG